MDNEQATTKNFVAQELPDWLTNSKKLTDRWQETQLPLDVAQYCFAFGLSLAEIPELKIS